MKSNGWFISTCNNQMYTGGSTNGKKLPYLGYPWEHFKRCKKVSCSASVKQCGERINSTLPHSPVPALDTVSLVFQSSTDSISWGWDAPVKDLYSPLKSCWTKQFHHFPLSAKQVSLWAHKIKSSCDIKSNCSRWTGWYFLIIKTNFIYGNSILIWNFHP